MLIYSPLTLSQTCTDQKTTPPHIDLQDNAPPPSLNYDHIWKSYTQKAFINDVSPAALEIHESYASVK